MKIRHEDYLGEYSLKGRYRIGDMSEVLEMFNEKFDVIIFAYTTFGCYSDDEQNAEVLRKINNILLPGGVVIIEQFNPAIKEAEKPYWVVDEIIDGRSICLEKTTRYKSFPGDNNYALYTGEYTYKEFTPFGSNLLRRDYYCLKLYKDFWIKNIFNDPKYLIEEINICEDFDINSKYIGDEKSAHMICIIKKYSEGIERLCTIEDAKKILTKFEEILFLVSKHYPKELAGQEKVYKIKFSSIMTDDANSKSAVVEKIKKMPLDYEVFNELTGELKKEVVLKYLPIIAKYCHEK